jgi:fido (protein-threonine AMPylation protein)
MTEELPIYPDFRRVHRFPNLERVSHLDMNAALQRFDQELGERDGVRDPCGARSTMSTPGKAGLLDIHRTLYGPREGAGRLRGSPVAPVFDGQDCPEPEFLARALDNFEQWLGAESFGEIHPIEQAALCLTRIVDIWPFEFGNRTSAIVFANFFVVQAGYAPFWVSAQNRKAFSQALAASISMHTEPLAQAIYQSILRQSDRRDG